MSLGKYQRLLLVLLINIGLGVFVYLLTSLYLEWSLPLSLSLSVIFFVASFLLTVIRKLLQVKSSINYIRKSFDTVDLYPNISSMNNWICGSGFTGRLKHFQRALYCKDGV